MTDRTPRHARAGSRRLPADSEPVVSNTRLAIVIVIAAETMLFAGLVGMYLVFRLSAPDLAAARPAPAARRGHRAQHASCCSRASSR